MTKPYAQSIELFSSGRLGEGLVLPEGGRILTVPQILEIRRLYHPLDMTRSSPWTRPYLTGSREYRGLSPAGIDVLVIHHPQAGKPEPDHPNFDKDAFRDILDGKYGDIHVFDTRDVLGSGWTRRARRRLTQARLGGDTLEAAVLKQIHWQTKETHNPPSVTFQAVHGGLAPVGERPTSRRLWLAELRNETFAGVTDNEMRPVFEVTVSYEEQRAYNKRLTCIAFHSGGANPIDIAPPVSVEDVLRDEERREWRTDIMISPKLHRLQEFGGQLTTVLNGIRGAWPICRVTSFEPVDSPRSLIPRGFAHALRSMPAGANAYKVIGLRNDTQLQFGRAEIDTSIRLPDASELESALFPGSELADYHAERWWRSKTERAAA